MIKKGYDMMHAYAVKIRCIHKKKKKKKRRKEKKNKVKPLNGVSSAKFSILGLILNLSPLQLQYALPK
jgi:hypothetical protein